MTQDEKTELMLVIGIVHDLAEISHQESVKRNLGIAERRLTRLVTDIPYKSIILVDPINLSEKIRISQIY